MDSCLRTRGRVSVGAVGAAAPKHFSERLFCTHRNPLKQVNIQEFHLKLMKFDLLHPQLPISYATPEKILHRPTKYSLGQKKL